MRQRATADPNPTRSHSSLNLPPNRVAPVLCTISRRERPTIHHPTTTKTEMSCWIKEEQHQARTTEQKALFLRGNYWKNQSPNWRVHICWYRGINVFWGLWWVMTTTRYWSPGDICLSYRPVRDSAFKNRGVKKFRLDFF